GGCGCDACQGECQKQKCAHERPSPFSTRLNASGRPAKTGRQNHRCEPMRGGQAPPPKTIIGSWNGHAPPSTKSARSGSLADASSLCFPCSAICANFAGIPRL